MNNTNTQNTTDSVGLPILRIECLSGKGIFWFLLFIVMYCSKKFRQYNFLCVEETECRNFRSWLKRSVISRLQYSFVYCRVFEYCLLCFAVTNQNWKTVFLQVRMVVKTTRKRKTSKTVIQELLNSLKVLCYLQFLKNTKYVQIVLNHF